MKVTIKNLQQKLCGSFLVLVSGTLIPYALYAQNAGQIKPLLTGFEWKLPPEHLEIVTRTYSKSGIGC